MDWSSRNAILHSQIMVADEAVAALDISVRSHVLKLFAQVNENKGMFMLLFTHFLHVARAVVDTALVMHECPTVEQEPVNAILDNPQTALTRSPVLAVQDLGRAMTPREVAQLGAGTALVG